MTRSGTGWAPALDTRRCPPSPPAAHATQLSWDSLPESQLWMGPRPGRSPPSLKLAGIPLNATPPRHTGDEAALCAPTIPVTILPPNALGGALRAEIFPSRL